MTGEDSGSPPIIGVAMGSNKAPPGRTIGLRPSIVVHQIKGTGFSRFLAAATMAWSDGKNWRSMPI